METPVKNPVQIRERKIILLLCLLAVAHVFIFSATFPFFNIVDEQVQFDLVVRYAEAAPPRAIGPPCAEALPYIAIYGTTEYFWPPSTQPGGHTAPPPWTLPINVVAENLRAKEAIWVKMGMNHEVSQPPLYYTVAGAWWRLGKILGLDGGRLLYWLRFLNIPLVVALVWLGAFAARKIFPENDFVRLAVPAFIAFMPQTAFYAINNDIFSPLTFGIAFVLLVKFWNAENLSPRLALAIGLALAATFLTKISNLPLLAVAGIFLTLKVFRLAQDGKLRGSVWPLAILFLCAGVPMAAWLAWCKYTFGDLTGTTAKIQFLGWTHKPFAEWWHHPIFTAPGFWFFLKGNLSTFWQGEFLWQRKPLALPWADLAYVAASIILAGVALLNLLTHSKNATAPQRRALWFSFACFAAAVAFLGFLSLLYDFHDCFYPSREHPYFTSGRLMLGALIPFLLLFTFGLDQAMKKFSSATKFTVLTALLLFMLVTEITTDWQIFPNAYNWFHM